MPLVFATYRVDPLTARASGALRCPPEAICVGAPQPVVVVWLQVLVAIAVSELVLPEFATNTFPAAASNTTASGAAPVVTELALAKSEGSLVLPSLSTLTALFDLSAM